MTRFVAATRNLGLAVALTLATFAACLSAGCVSPKSDYDDWLSRTADARAAGPTVNDASFDAALDGGFQQTYFMFCVSQLTSESVNESTIFVSNITYTPSGGGGQSGTLTVQNTSLPIGATDMTQTIGAPGKSTCTVSPDGRCDAPFGPSVVPAAGDPLGTGDITFTDSTLHFVIGSQTELCAHLGGDLTTPLVFTFDPSKNVCAYVIPEGGAVPDYKSLGSLISACPYP
jgi:hypothetical protein